MPDPRINLQAQTWYCKEFIGSTTSERQNFFQAVNNLGNFQGLTQAGTTGAAISQGLRTLASISNTVRSGCGSLPTSIGAAVGQGLDAGVGWVFDNVGIARTAVDAVRQFNPNIANQALGQAQQIYRQVKQGNFKYTDIPFAFQNLQNLERLARNIFTPSVKEQNAVKVLCEASPYAMDLIAKAPKHKFMWVVQIIPSAAYASAFNNLDIAFVAKTSTRPNVKYTMDDINFYNYRTKVVTKSEFQEMNMTFYDDMANLAGAFHAAYLKATVPISNFPNGDQAGEWEENGMNFFNTTTADPVPGGNDASFADGAVRTINPNTAQLVPINRYPASTGALAEDSKTVIQEIRVFHLYDGGRQMNYYKFFNPRITELKLDDLDMAATDTGNEVAFSFTYDSVYIDTAVSFKSGDMAAAAKTVSKMDGSAAFGLRYVSSGSEIQGTSNIGLQPFGSPAQVSDNCSTQLNTQSPPTSPG